MTIPKIDLGDSQIPQLGLGLWQVKPAANVNEAVHAALKNGYTHFDTAQIYGNEGMLADALANAGVERKDVYITTKISVTNFMSFRTKKSFETSLKKLQTDYVDLLLLHFPVSRLRHRAWRDLEELHAQGKAKSIGVSNYTVRHLKQLLKTCKVKPAINQVELHVFLQQPELVEYCHKNNIVIEAYSPLAHGYGMDDPLLQSIAKKHGKSTAQIMLRWCVQQGFVVLPKSVHEERVKQNADIFDFKLDDQDLSVIKNLDRNHRTCWDPTRVI